MRSTKMRPEAAFYFFKGEVCQTPKSAVTTLVTYRKRKKLLPLFVGNHTPYIHGLQRMYATLVKRGTLTLRGIKP